MSPAGGVLKRIQKAELSACDGAVSFLQSGFWGAFKARFGWEALAFKVKWGAGNSTTNQHQPTRTEEEFDTTSSWSNKLKIGSHSLLVLRRRLAAGLSLAYVPWGPELPPGFPADLSGAMEERAAILRELALALKKLLPRDTAFIRFDPPWFTEGSDALPPGIPPPFIRSGADIQPPDTVLVDLTQPMEEIIARMKPKWRYNARLALKKGVTLRRAGVEGINVFYDLLKETAKRDGIAIHGIGYYRTLLAEGSSNPSLQINLYLAEHGGDALAGIVTLFRGKEAVYLYGASSDKKRNLMAPYALQLQAMEDARASGCREYDLFGIPPRDDPSHPMAGLYRFKTGFGGRIIHRPGSWDFPCRPLVYRIFRGAETLRKNLRTVKKSISRKRKGSAGKL